MPVLFNCFICKGDAGTRDVIGKLPCRHVFHYECIHLKLFISDICPACKHISIYHGKSIKSYKQSEITMSIPLPKEAMDQSGKFSNDPQKRVNDCEQTIETLLKANTHTMEAIEKLQQECEQIKNLFKKFSTQFESNSKHSIELQKHLNESEQTVGSVKELNVLQTNSSELQNLRHECDQNFGFLKQVNTQLEQSSKQSHDKDEKFAESSMELKIVLKNVAENVEKILMAQEQTVKAEKQNITTKESLPNAAAENTSFDSTQHMHKDLQNSLETDSARNSDTNGKSSIYEPIDDSAMKNEVALKNQVIQDLEQKLAEKNSLLEQEKEHSKQLTVQRNKLQKCLSDLVKEQQKVLLTHINTAERCVFAETLADESDIRQEVVVGDDPKIQNHAIVLTPK